MNYTEQMAAELADLMRTSERSIALGRGAATVLADPSVAEFFASRAKIFAKSLIDVDAQDAKACCSVILAIQSVAALHEHLTRAVESGNAAALRLVEESSKGNKP